MVKQQPYRLWLDEEVHEQRKSLPGNYRQRIKREIEKLLHQPRSTNSCKLDFTGLNIPNGVEIRRLRLGNWRILYAVNDVEKWVWVFALRERPPYDYEDLPKIISKL